LFSVLELKSYDLRFKARGPQKMDASHIAIVGIDDQSFEDLKLKWPFPRRLFALAIRNLKAAGARLIILDIEFSDPDKYNRQNDLLLARTAKAVGNVIFAGKLSNYKRAVGKRIIKPIPTLLNSGSEWALIDVPEVLDGFHRQYFLYRRLEKDYYFPFAITAFQRAFGQRLSATNGSVTLGKRSIPAIGNTFLVNFRGPAETFPTYSFSSILDDKNFDLGEADSDIFELHKNQWQTFKNKIVFIGSTTDVLQDVKLTPFYGYSGSKKKMPGVEPHANALSTLIRGDFIRLAPISIQLLAILILTALMTYLGTRSRVWIGLLYVFGIAMIYIVFAYALFVSAHLWLEIVRPVVAVSIAYVGTVAQQVIIERREKGRVKRTFQQYVSRSVVDTMLASGDVPNFGGEQKELTVLFSDIRSFTTYCESRSPESVVHVLNEYLSSMVDIIFKHRGTLDKFVGDEIMAVYGAPLYYRGHAVKACETACVMIDSLRAMQKRWSSKAQDYFQIGIGINTGNMIVGNLGSSQLFDYTVIGDEVNLGARLEGANKQYWTTIIISESTYRHVKNRAVARELDLVRVKGKNLPVKIYELRSMAPVPPIEQDLII
ncbi:MAG: CHASE2 domain-containing protein, partial [bacterium]